MISSKPIEQQRCSGVIRGVAILFVFLVFVLAQASTVHAACVGGTRNGIVQTGEDCDDNNASNTDACTNDCKWASCGDGYTCTTNCALSDDLSGAEDCDDAGESSGCNADCTLADCGDGKLNVTRGEQCDDGNPSNTDACLTTCITASCGDGFVQSGVEECDDADASNSDGCLDTCKWATCGDSFVCVGGCVTPASGQVNPNLSGTEACDTGGESVTCDADCTAPACGDGVPNAAAGEECDDGDNDGGPNECRPGCLNPWCGDGTVDAGEECDDGDLQDNDFCTTKCEWASCGDGYTCTDTTGADACVNSPSLDGIEACDNGTNNGDTKACLSTCVAASCGDGFVWAGVEGCDDGDDDNADECRNNCVAATCGDGIIQNETNEQCDDGQSQCAGGYNIGADCTVNADCPGRCDNTTPNENQPCTPATVAADCGALSGCNMLDAFCDGSGNNDQYANACRSNCLFEYCGDGVIDTGETCDSGVQGTSGGCVISSKGDQPSASSPINCQLADCGDGLTCSDSLCTTGPSGAEEQCDDGNAVATDGCRNNCATNVCGDGVRNCGPDGVCDNSDDVEECDQGVSNSDTIADRCRTDCTNWGCGDGVTDLPENCDDAGESATCNDDCTFVACGDGVLNTTAGEQCDEGDVANGDGCSSTCQIEGCQDGVVNNSGSEECDPAVDFGETAVCDSNCSFADCGDDDLNVTRGEQCDDGNTVPGDGCDAACQEESCGDGVVNNALDGVPTEDCDDGVFNSDVDPDACRTNCDAAGCGDSVTDVLENCDDGGESASCDDDCTFVICGDANVNQAAGEECDDGDNDGGANECRAGCIAPVCGDGTVDGGFGEQCDSPISDECTFSCCSTGANPESYNTGLVGIDCQLSNLEASCDVSVCKRAKRIDRRIVRMGTGLAKADALATEGRLSRAERTVRGIRNRAGAVLKNLGRLCPGTLADVDQTEARDCLKAELDAIVVIALETEKNLELENP